jgi:ribose 1,5-bisphosphokinase
MTGRSGRLIAVVGPSGVGKDSLLEFARNRLAGAQQIRFVRRTITRPAGSGGETHDAMAEDEFRELERKGGFAVSWHAHGLSYGIPVAVKDFVDAGGVAVANGSRHAMARFASAFTKLTVVSITAKPEVLAARLRKRGRESDVEIERRLNRGDTPFPGFGEVIAIDNSGSLEVAGNQLVAVIEAARSQTGAASNSDAGHPPESSFKRFLESPWPFL